MSTTPEDGAAHPPPTEPPAEPAPTSATRVASDPGSSRPIRESSRKREGSTFEYKQSLILERNELKQLVRETSDKLQASSQMASQYKEENDKLTDEVRDLKNQMNMIKNQFAELVARSQPTQVDLAKASVHPFQRVSTLRPSWPQRPSPAPHVLPTSTNPTQNLTPADTDVW